MLVAKSSRRRWSGRGYHGFGAEFERLEARTLLTTAVHIADYFPLADGNTWSYTGTLGNPADAATATMASHANITEQGRLVTTLDFDITSGSKTRDETSYYAHTPTGLRLFRVDVTGPASTMTRITDGARLLPPDPVVGQVYNFSRSVTGKISPSNVTFTGTVTGTVELEDFELLTTGVGTYRALKMVVTQNYTDTLSNSTTQTGTISKTQWIIKGIGIGRVLYHETSANSGGTSSTKDWDLILSGTPLASEDPRLQVYGDGLKIKNGDTTPRFADNTAFGAADVNGGMRGRNFVLTNTGSQPLTLSPVSMGDYISITGVNAADFSVTIQPAKTTLQPGESTFFRVRYDPSAAGVSNATITINSDSAADSTYSFDVRGTGVELGTIGLTGGMSNTTIQSGTLTTDTTDGTRFGSVAAAGHNTLTSTFTIDNSGPGSLRLLGNPLIQILGVNASNFTVTILPSSSIVSGDHTTFTITFDPSAKGFRKAFVSILSNDRHTPLFTFAISGNGL